MNALLVRVAVDRSVGGGLWNGPMDSLTGEFAYVAIPEQRPVHPGLEKPYSSLATVLERFGVRLPAPLGDRDMNAHSRRTLAPEAQDLIVLGRPGLSGRLRRCLPIGEYRNGAYRIRRDLLELWGGLSVKDGFLQRSARLPRLLDPPR